MRIIITGGSSGVGAQTAAKLASRGGHEIFNFDIKAPESDHPGVRYIACDLSSESSIDRAFAQVEGPIDQLLNVAGVARGLPSADIVGINFLGPRHLVDLAAPRMNKGGGIVNVSSTAGQQWKSRFAKLKPLLETRSMAEGIKWCHDNDRSIKYDPYTLSKRCLTAYTLLWAEHALKAGIRMNAVCPGLIDTPLFPDFKEIMGDAHTDWFIEQIGRPASASEVADVLVMLATQPCDAINGTLIYTDRGYSAGVETGWIDEHNSPAFIRARELAAKKQAKKS